MIDCSNYSFSQDDVKVDVRKNQGAVSLYSHGGSEVVVTHKPTGYIIRCIGDKKVSQESLLKSCYDKFERMLIESKVKI